MNLYIFELKSHIKSTIFWVIGMFFLLFSGMAKMQTFGKSGQSVHELFGQMPKIFKALFGISDFDLSTAKGFFVLMFLYVLFLVAVHAVLLGSELLSKEERDKTNEFLLSKPISRTAIINSKLAAGLSLVVIYFLTTVLLCIWTVGYFNNAESITGDIIYLSLGLLLTQIVFFGIGLFIGAMSHKPSQSNQIGIAAVLISYFIFVSYSLAPNFAWLKYISCFNLFDANTILKNGYQAISVLIAAFVTIICVFFAYRAYNKREQSF